jgi:DNA-binding transcriptional LysR family regulator
MRVVLSKESVEMNEKDWDVLQAVYDEKSITRAAEKLFMSQPALTYRLKHLEELFDIQIFVRGRRMIKFTTEGEHLVQYGKKMGIEFRKLKSQLQELKQGISGELRLGVSSNFAGLELPDLLKRFHDLYPNVQFHVHTAWSIDIYERITNEEDHVGIIRGDYDWEDSKILMDEDEVCIVSREQISLEDLPNLPRIRHQSGPDTKKIADQWWQERFTQPPYISMEVGNLETCKKMVLKGLGYGIIPRYSLKEEDVTGIFIHPLTVADGNPILRKLWAYYREEDTKLSVVRAFVDFLKKNYAID